MTCLFWTKELRIKDWNLITAEDMKSLQIEVQISLNQRRLNRISKFGILDFGNNYIVIRAKSRSKQVLEGARITLDTSTYYICKNKGKKMHFIRGGGGSTQIPGLKNKILYRGEGEAKILDFGNFIPYRWKKKVLLPLVCNGNIYHSISHM